MQDLIDGDNLKVVTRHTLAGEAYNSVEIQTCDDSVLPVIYLPASGYVEGESLKNATHANVWTRTLLSNHQGFDTTSPEFGFWYHYFDAYGKICTMSNLRFVSGSNGRNTGIYRAADTPDSQLRLKTGVADSIERLHLANKPEDVALLKRTGRIDR